MTCDYDAEGESGTLTHWTFFLVLSPFVSVLESLEEGLSGFFSLSVSLVFFKIPFFSSVGVSIVINLYLSCLLFQIAA